MGKEVSFDVTISIEDVDSVLKALMKRFKAGRDEPMKTVFLSLVVAEVEVLLYRDLMSKLCENLDEVIAGVRLQAKERAKYFHESR